MATLTITDAARVTGVSRMLLYRYIKSGKLSRTPDGLIDPAALLRAGLLLHTTLHLSQFLAVRKGVPGHEEALKRLTSLQAMSPTTARRCAAPPPDLTRYKV